MARDPDATTIAIFKVLTIESPGKTAGAGRPIFDDVDVCELRYAGSKNVSAHPATAVSHWQDDPMTGMPVAITYAERFPMQYQQFRRQATQTKAGTPIAFLQSIPEARRAEMRAMNIYTVEALAAIEGAELKNLGPGGRDAKNAAIEYLEEAKTLAPNTAMLAELDALRARNEILEEDQKHLKAKMTELSGKDGLDDMSLEQMREYITSTTGHAPHGSLGRKTLLRMAQDAYAAQQNKQAVA